MGPHADFACLSKKCTTDDGATVYDLPVATTRCPVCGSKRIKRLWTGQAPGVLSTGYRERQGMIDRAGARAVDHYENGKAAARRIEKDNRELWAQGIGVTGGVSMMPMSRAKNEPLIARALAGASYGSGTAVAGTPPQLGALKPGPKSLTSVHGSWDGKS